MSALILLWRNEECAMSSTRRVVKIAERYKKKIHVLHVTTKEEVEFLSRYKGNVSFEITPQHLTLTAPLSVTRSLDLFHK